MRFFSTFLLCAAAFTSAAEAARPIAFDDSAPKAGTLIIPAAKVEEIARRAAVLGPEQRGAVERALKSTNFDYSEGSKLSLRGIGSWSQILVIGTGDKPLDNVKLQNLGGTAAQAAAKDEGPVAIMTSGLGNSAAEAAAQLAIGAELGGYSFERYKYVDPAKPRSAGLDAPLTIVSADSAGAERAYHNRAKALVEGVVLARNLVTEPANVIYPETFVDRVRQSFEGVQGVTIEVLDVPAMERLGMNAILSVGQGSARPPRLLIVHYKGASGQPIALAGKGITFDSGGISLKGRERMWRMKNDMAGAAAVVGAVLSLAKTKAPVNVVALAALAENMPGGSAARPGDVVRAYNGKTIEIHSTDAEGRLVLADTVAYAERRFRPAVITDIATLTGSAAMAFGGDYAALMTRHEELSEQLIAAGRSSGEELWRLPLRPSHAKAMKSDIADIKNTAEGAPAGAQLGGYFIGYFVDQNTPWAHIDMAGVAMEDEGSPTVPKGATGYGVRLLDQFVRNFRPIPASGQTGS